MGRLLCHSAKGFPEAGWFLWSTITKDLSESYEGTCGLCIPVEGPSESVREFGLSLPSGDIRAVAGYSAIKQQLMATKRMRKLRKSSHTHRLIAQGKKYVQHFPHAKTETKQVQPLRRVLRAINPRSAICGHRSACSC